MDDATLIGRRRTSQMAFYRALGSAGAGSHWREVRPGVQATVVPAAPDRSLPNSVLYTDAHGLLDAHDEIAELYAAAGVRAWTVWVVPGDDELAVSLEARGHTLDGSPALMVAAMDEVDLGRDDEPQPLDLDPEPDWRVIGDLNDRAYGLPDATFAPCVARMHDPAVHGFVARLDGVPAACLATVDGPDGDCALARGAASTGAGPWSRLGARPARAAGGTGSRLRLREPGGLEDGRARVRPAGVPDARQAAHVRAAQRRLTHALRRQSGIAARRLGDLVHARRTRRYGGRP